MNFFCFRGNRVNIQGVSTDKATRKSVHKFWRNLQFSFLTRITLMLCKIRGFFSKSERKKKPIHVPIVKKVHRLQGSQYALLDHSKPSILVTLYQKKILSKCSRARAIRTHSSRAKKTI